MQRICLPLFATVLLSSSLLCAETAESRFHLYYGSDPGELSLLTAQVQKGSIVAIDVRAFDSAELKKFVSSIHIAGGKVIAYLSIGELHSSEINEFRPLLEGAELKSITIDKNETFNSYRVDVASPAWRSWIMSQSRLILDRGVDGLFLDTVDTIDRYASKTNWSLKTRGDRVQSMIDLIRSIKKTFPDCYVLQNGGLNMIGSEMFVGAETGLIVPGQSLAKSNEHNPDGLLWENAFATKDAWAAGRFEILKQIHNAGHTSVFALGYQDRIKDAKRFFQQCNEAGFSAAWGNSSQTLHESTTVLSNSLDAK